METDGLQKWIPTSMIKRRKPRILWNLVIRRAMGGRKREEDMTQDMEAPKRDWISVQPLVCYLMSYTYFMHYQVCVRMCFKERVKSKSKKAVISHRLCTVKNLDCHRTHVPATGTATWLQNYILHNWESKTMSTRWTESELTRLETSVFVNSQRTFVTLLRMENRDAGAISRKPINWVLRTVTSLL